jgi:hypothetical protein
MAAPQVGRLLKSALTSSSFGDEYCLAARTGSKPDAVKLLLDSGAKVDTRKRGDHGGVWDRCGGNHAVVRMLMRPRRRQCAQICAFGNGQGL